MMYSTLSIVPLAPKHFNVFIKQAIKAYAIDLHRFGEVHDNDDAEKTATTEINRYLPHGQHSENQHIFAIKKDERNTVGYLWFIAKPPEDSHISTQLEAFLAYIWVDKKYRQQKIASYALDFFEQTVRHTYHATCATLYVFQNNVPAVALYKKRGYIIIKSAKFYQATEQTRFYMHKDLT